MTRSTGRRQPEGLQAYLLPLDLRALDLRVADVLAVAARHAGLLPVKAKSDA